MSNGSSSDGRPTHGGGGGGADGGAGNGGGSNGGGSAAPCGADQYYNLLGGQVEPSASYWNHCPRLRLVSIKELTTVTDDEKKREKGFTGPWGYFPAYEPADNAKELDEIRFLALHRDDPECLEEKDASRRRLPISQFFSYCPPALGAVQVNRLPCDSDYRKDTCVPAIRTGRGMARAVEAETPGIFHRHALNLLILQRFWSAPRQALIWAALDIVIASALQAAWYYKWLSPRKKNGRFNPARRPRPVECDRSLSVLFDNPDELNPSRMRCPTFSPGTPRHPAYPSGHSTYAGAASEFLAFFFPEKCDELMYLADNIGLGRMWAGIHWRSDHIEGLKLGRTVAHLVLQQLADMGNLNPDVKNDLCPPEPMDQKPLTCAELDQTPRPGLKCEREKPEDAPENRFPIEGANGLAAAAAAFAAACNLPEIPPPTARKKPVRCRKPKPVTEKAADEPETPNHPPGLSVQSGAL